MWQARLFEISYITHVYFWENTHIRYMCASQKLLRERRGGRKRKREFAPFANTWNHVASQPQIKNALQLRREHWNFQYCAVGLPWLMRRYGFRRRCLVPHAVAARAPWKRAERHRPNTLEIDSHTVRDLSQNTVARIPQLKNQAGAESAGCKFRFAAKNFKILRLL